MSIVGRGARPHSNTGNQSEHAKVLSPHRTEVQRIATLDGHEIKLVRETGEA